MVLVAITSPTYSPHLLGFQRLVFTQGMAPARRSTAGSPQVQGSSSSSDTDSTGDWYVWDTAQGIVTGDDPNLSLNTTAAVEPSNDSIDPDSSGFIVNQVAATNINVSSASYIFYAIS
jgi:hypothetical protein